MKKNISLLFTAVFAVSMIPLNVYADDATPDDTKYTLTFKDFDGNTMETIEVSPDEKIDYSKIDTSSLHTHIDTYTEQAFYMWSATPEYITSDTVIDALYKKATISVDSLPTVTEYHSKDGEVSLDGLSVSIRLDIQTPVTDENGDYFISSQTENITSSCYAEVSSLAELFADGNTASVNVFPPGDDKAIVTYDITLIDEPVETKYTLTFTDFDGKTLETMEVSPDEKIDYSKIDTSSLSTRPDTNTKQDFYMWSETPEYIDSDTVINALYKKSTVSVDSLPTTTEYTVKDGDVLLDGLSVSIKTDTQTPEKDKNGNYIILSDTEDITADCYAEVPSLAELFKDGNTASVKILSSKCDQPVTTYDINFKEPVVTKYTLTFTDFDGKTLETMEVSSDEKIDYSKIDTSSLHTHPDIYTEQAFCMWSATPEYIDSDTVINALYKKATISVDGVPKKTEYYTSTGDVSLDGLSVSIKTEKQTPEKDKNNNYIILSDTENITSSCYAEVTSLAELFKDGKNAVVNVIPLGDDKPLVTYEITLFDELGDTNNDGLVDSVDSTFVLKAYADMSAHGSMTLDENQVKICDVNRDGLVDAVDATAILIYYAQMSTGRTPVWEEIVPALTQN